MQPFFFLILSLVLSLAIIPVMIRYAPALGLIDKPNRRKVHTRPVARVGGVGIVTGTLVAVLIAFPSSELIQAYVGSSLILFLFGLADDRMDLGHYAKFLGQFAAASIMVFWGGLYVTRIPFFNGFELPPALGMPFTLFAVVGVMNAINHSDGLDGLAGGETLLSLLALFVLSYQAEGIQASLVAAAAIGGVLGFLRYNTHPAMVFMGDSGSQFLGYTLGFLVILLTQEVNPAISAALPLLLIGLPIVDILVVLGLRIRAGRSWFRATRNHIHHRLLDLKFVHAESVVVIYSVQAFFVICAVALCYYSDWLIAVVYLAVSAALFSFLMWAEKTGWRADSGTGIWHPGRWLWRASRFEIVKRAPGRALAVLFTTYLIHQILTTGHCPAWTLPTAVALLITQLAMSLFFRQKESGLARIVVYTAVGMIAYLQVGDGAGASTWSRVLTALIALSIGMGLRWNRGEEFRGTPLDYLVLLFLIGVVIFSSNLSIDPVLAHAVITGVVLLYGCEYLLNVGKRYTGLARHLPVICLVAIALRDTL